MAEINSNLLDDSSKLFLFIRGMEIDKKLFDSAVNEKKRDEAFIHFYHFLCDLFALREKCGYEDVDSVSVGNKEKKQKVKADSVYGALKTIYESIKHRDKIDVSLGLESYVSSASYPRTYPFCYGKAHYNVPYKVDTTRERDCLKC